MKPFISSINDSIIPKYRENRSFKSYGNYFDGNIFSLKMAYAINIGDSTSELEKTKSYSNLTIVDHTDADNKHALTRFLGMSYINTNAPSGCISQKINLGFKEKILLCLQTDQPIW